MNILSMTATMLMLFSFNVLAAEETVVAQIYPVGGLDGKPFFIQTTNLDREAGQSFKSKAKIVDADGRILMTETVEVKNGMLVSQSVEQLQTQEAWDLLVQGKQATYRSFKKSSEKKVLQSENTISVGESFINGPMMEMFVERYWQELLQGKTLKSDFSVLELEKAVSFTFSKVKESVRKGRKVVVVKMAPANFVISIFVDPLILEFDLERKRLVYFKGRTPLKDPKDLKRPFDAEIHYEIQN